MFDCWAGKEADGTEVRVCGRGEHLDNCTDEACAKLCIDKYGTPSGKDANGFCEPPSTCACTYVCPPHGA